MGCPTDLSGINMNDQQVIGVYTQLVKFQSNLFAEETVFCNPDNSLQRTIHELAHRLGLEFEYSLLTRSARITRPVCETLHHVPGPENNNPSAPAIYKISSHGIIEVNHEQKGNSSWDSTAPESNTPGMTPPLDFNYPIFRPAKSEQDSSSVFSMSKDSAYYGTTNSSLLQDSLINRIDLSPSTNKNGMSSKRSYSGISEASGYQEIVFETHSGRSVCSGSAPSLRRGTMDLTSRESMKAVKAVGACWRCKFLKKNCETNDPCEACPKSSRKSTATNWGLVGCRRGTFADDLPIFSLSPVRGDNTTTYGRDGSVPPFDNPNAFYVSGFIKDPDERLQIPVNARQDDEELQQSCLESSQWEAQSQARDLDMESIRTSEFPDKRLFDLVFGQSEYTKCWKPLHRIQWQQQPCLFCEAFLPKSLTSLDECIVAILWEARHCNLSKELFMAGETTKFSNLWDVAAFCDQLRPINSNLKTYVLNQLISLALGCLRSCLEILRLVYLGLFNGSSHEIECRLSADIERSIKLYIDELSRVFFKKENIRSKERWWLSTFYSLCIQGFVRRALLQLKPGFSGDDATNQYLYLVVRLFSASSGTYDPMIRDYVSSGKDVDQSTTENFKSAQLALHQYKWTSARISVGDNIL